MKKIIFILIINGILLQAFSKLVIYSNYRINKDYIAQNLCENKAKSEMKCEGKCHLKKELKQQEEKESLELVVKCKSESWLLNDITDFKPLLFLLDTYSFDIKTNLTQGIVSSGLQPPEFYPNFPFLLINV